MSKSFRNSHQYHCRRRNWTLRLSYNNLTLQSTLTKGEVLTMADKTVSTIWGIHQEWNATSTPQETKDVAIGWQKLGDLSTLSSSREAFKTAFGKAHPEEKPGAVPVKAGVLFRFSKEMAVGDVIVYPSKSDRLVNVGSLQGTTPIFLP
jgi:hypothetical protein